MPDRHPGDLRMTQVMLRPRWIVSLVLALALAGGFAWLGQWQLSRAIASGQVGPRTTEAVKPIFQVVDPGTAIASGHVGQLAEVPLEWVPGDFSLLTGRSNNGETGYWLVGHARVVDDRGLAGAPGSGDLAVALGFTADRERALAARDAANATAPAAGTVTGRLLPTEPPEQPADNGSGDPPQYRDLSVALLINQWHSVGASVYEVYLVAHDHVPAGLVPIYSPPPLEQESVNWLNAFYAAEWALFAGFAIFLWYRVVRDAWERERYPEDAEAAPVESEHAPGPHD